MYDAGCPSETHQRARGRIDLAFGPRDGATVLRRLYQDGCLRARFPRVEPGGATEAVLLNTGGGVAAGDVLAVSAEIAPGARATIATQAAERIYRALPGSAPASVTTALRVGAGAVLDWLPQETILFDRARLDRVLEIDVAADARFLGVESVVFGRTAMGETVAHGMLHDMIRLRRDGRLRLRDTLRLDGGIAARLARPAVANGARAIATLLLAAPDAEAHLPALRAAWADAPAECGASAWDGLLIGRVLAPDGAALRRAIIAGLTALRDAHPMPRVWML